VSERGLRASVVRLGQGDRRHVALSEYDAAFMRAFALAEMEAEDA
jgi:hypothetical protein